MNGLVFEKVGDVTSTYPYVCVYRHGEKEPFMEFGVNDEKELMFTFYRSEGNAALSLAEWDQIRARAVDFLPRVIADEDAALRR